MKKTLILFIACIIFSTLSAHAEKPDKDMQIMADILLDISKMGDNFDYSKLKKYEKYLSDIQFWEVAVTSDENKIETHDSVAVNFTQNWVNAMDSLERNAPHSISNGIWHSETGRGGLDELFNRSERKNRYFTQRIKIKAGQSFKISFRDQGRFQILAVAEKGGLLTTKLHAHDSKSRYDKHFDDTDKFHQGKNVRNKAIALPDKYVDIDVEIINRADHDITCVLVCK